MIRINLLGHEDRTPRYMQLRRAAGKLERAIQYLNTTEANLARTQAFVTLGESLRYVKGEMRRPWAFNPDGSPRFMRMYDSTNGAARGPFPPTHGIEGASRQVRRALARVVGFSQMSFVHTRHVETDEIGPDGKPILMQKSGRAPAMPRGLRRQIAKGAKFPIQSQENSNGESNATGTTTATEA